jgi:hypothetical protein
LHPSRAKAVPVNPGAAFDFSGAPGVANRLGRSAWPSSRAKKPAARNRATRSRAFLAWSEKSTTGTTPVKTGGDASE